MSKIVPVYHELRTSHWLGRLTKIGEYKLTKKVKAGDIIPITVKGKRYKALVAVTVLPNNGEITLYVQ